MAEIGSLLYDHRGGKTKVFFMCGTHSHFSVNLWSDTHHILSVRNAGNYHVHCNAKKKNNKFFTPKIYP